VLVPDDIDFSDIFTDDSSDHYSYQDYESIDHDNNYSHYETADHHDHDYNSHHHGM
jgi:hypothetical protein